MDKVINFITANCDPPPFEDETAILQPKVEFWSDDPNFFICEGRNFGAWLARNTTPDFFKGTVKGLADELSSNNMLGDGWEQLDFSFYFPE